MGPGVNFILHFTNLPNIKQRIWGLFMGFVGRDW